MSSRSKGRKILINYGISSNDLSIFKISMWKPLSLILLFALSDQKQMDIFSENERWNG